MKSTKGNPKILSTNQFPVVGIGASAGGLEAFRRLIKAIPENSGMAYVLVQHLDPTRESLLPEILQKVTLLPVSEVRNDVKVEPDHIYIIPSNRMLQANDGVLELTPRPPKSAKKLNLPINLFFTSLAEVHRSHAIGVILSGTGSDGTKGLETIKDAGGLTFAQDEVSAAFEGMPFSALHAGVVDFVLPPEEIPKKIFELKQLVNITDEALQHLPEEEEQVHKQILILLRLRKGTDFTFYKQTTIRRRTIRRMAIHRIKEASEYLNYLRKHVEEQEALYQDLLIHVTAFFRDEKIFENLCSSVFPKLVAGKTPEETIRCWVAGCSTGEEVYSIAICLKEALGDRYEKVQIFATDINERAIAKARSGNYTQNEVSGVSAERLSAFFEKNEDTYRVSKELRSMCVFAIHNFLKDPPFVRLDFVSCRNVLIYMEPYLQKKALTHFHHALNPKGWLLLGKAETSGSVPELFAPAEGRDKLFIRKDVGGEFTTGVNPFSEREFTGLHNQSKVEQTAINFKKVADDIMLAKYTPPGVVVNEAMDIVHFRGSTGKYLMQGDGKPSHNLLKLAKEGLAFELRHLLHKVKNENVAAIKDDITLSIDGVELALRIEVMPLPRMNDPHYLVIFHEKAPAVTGDKGSDGTKVKTPSKQKEDKKDLRIQQLEKELVQIREDIVSFTDSQAAANDELQNANEELLSGNEELQSLHEQQITNREELQSSNEELTIANQELINLNEQVTGARNYAEAIITTIREPLLVIDKNLRVKSANHAFYKTFRLNKEECDNKSIYEIGYGQWDIPQLHSLLETILPQKESCFDFEISHNFQLIGERTMLLNAQEIIRKKGEDKLILLVIEDITEKKQHQLKVQGLLKKFQNLLMQAPVPICIFRSPQFHVELANEQMLQFWGRAEAKVMGKPVFEAMPEVSGQGFEEFLRGVLTTGERFAQTEVPVNLMRGGKLENLFINLVCEALYEDDGTVSGVIAVVHEITPLVIARKRMEAQASMVQEMLMSAPGFVCILSGPNYVYELINEKYQSLFGKRKILGKPMLEALPELKGQGFDKLLDKVYNSGEPYVGIDMPINLARDEDQAPQLCYFNFSYQPMYDENRKINSILVFGYEVTEQVIATKKNFEHEQKLAKKLEEMVKQRTLELSEKNDELEKKNMELESFSYISSHDLQEPLRKVRTFASRILENESGALTEKGKDYFARIQSAIARMQTLIEDLLAYSHTNKAERKPEVVDLNQILEEVKTDLKESIEEKGATIESNHLCGADINPSQFRQLLHNLIGNALKFSDPGRKTVITIKSHTDRGSKLQSALPASAGGKSSLQAPEFIPDRKYCHIEFSDNGIGFEPRYGEKIFGVFQRLHGKEQYAGTGIGLSIVKKIVENHGGFITATGELNKGARFDIYIPTF